MPKLKDSERTIPKIYRRKYEDIAMLFWVEAQRDIVPAVTVEKSLYRFFVKCGIEDFNIESALVTYSRLKAEFVDLKYESTKTYKRDNKAEAGVH